MVDDKYKNRYELSKFFVSTISTYSAGAGAIILLGEPSLSLKYIFTCIGIFWVSIVFIYKSLYDTPEKVNNIGKSVKKHGVVYGITLLLTVFSTFSIISNTYSIISTILIYITLLVIAQSSVLVLDYLFSK